MRQLKHLFAVLVVSTIAIAANAQDTPAQKNEVLSTLIDKVVNAYGGDALTGMKNYRISELYISPASGQSHTPTLDNIGSVGQLLVRDIEGDRLYFENWFRGRSGIFSNATIINGDTAADFNLLAGTYGDAANDDPYAVAGGTMRTTDTLLALELHKARDEAKYLGSADYMNRSHDKVQIPFPQSPDLTLYIDGKTHLISRMTRDNPQIGLLDYVFSGHVSKNGITRATGSSFFLAGRPNLIGSRREITFNQDLSDSSFELPAELQKEGERLDTSEMIANRLSDKIYHVGQGNGFSVFIDTGNGIVAAGGYPGLRQRLARFREETGSYQPLVYQVVTHHHQDHLGGLGEAIEMGARLVTVGDNIDVIKASTRRELEPGRFLLVGNRVTLGSGSNRVEVYEVATLHAASYLVVYVPGSRTLFIADHFGSPYAEGIPTANRNTVSLHAALEPLDLNYNKIITAHGGRVFSARDFNKSVADFDESACPADKQLCQETFSF
ncbi:MAG: hypothetical protein HOC23_13420 [Halieaceae bacterium]|jgi:glyoxylase-like metal-dependent hydrolase (beta-lactamase superfamily II)|nr:hypothetical protein [Halieaceae bacterium]